MQQRKECELLKQELEEVKNDFTGLERETINSQSQDEQGSSSRGGILTRVTNQEKKILAIDLYKGCDSLFEKH